MLRKNFMIGVIASTLLGAAAPAVTASASASGHSCRNVSLRSNGQVLTATRGLTAWHIDCTVARKVAHGWLSEAEGTIETPHPLGFTCRSSTDGKKMTCVRGSARVRWRYASASASAVATTRVNAAHPATGETRKAMVRAAQRYARSHSDYPHFRVRRAVLSSANSRWGAVTLVAPDQNAATALLKRSNGHWKVTDFGTAFDCGAAPRAVLKDLVGGCYEDAD